MGSATGRVNVAQVDPGQAWQSLAQEPDAQLIDVRTQAEWAFVGIPDLSGIGKSPVLVEWAAFPGMSENPSFADTVIEELGDRAVGPLFFICRSGQRSMWAAQAVSAALADRGLTAKCINVAEGFEGDLDGERHRGRLNGWKHRGLAWRQS